MSHELHNFTPALEVIRTAQAFHAGARALLSEGASRMSSERDRGFALVVVESEQKLADALAHALEDDAALPAAERWFQNPPESAPNLDELSAIDASTLKADALFATVRDIHERWIAIHEALIAQAPEGAAELFRSCRDLERSAEQHLASALVQLNDL